MDLLHTGSNELVYIQTDKVCLTIKGKAAHPKAQGIEYSKDDSSFKVFCSGDYELSLKGCIDSGATMESGGIRSGIYAVPPIFFEQQPYELIIEAQNDHAVAFWHDNLNLRNKITTVGRNDRILSGVINFGNEIGLSDLVIQIDGSDYLRVVIEVFPSKISYKEDYQAIIADVTNEVYKVVFDFLKKTYLGYQQSDRINNSPVEFFAIITKIFNDFLKAADMILSQPHHILEITHEVLPVHKIKSVDNKGLRWICKHPDQASISGGKVAVAKTLAVKKQVTYDTKENRLTKYILQSTIKKLESFKRNYLRLQRVEDRAVILQIDDMVKSLNRRCATSFLANVSPYEASSGMSLVFSMAPGYRDLYKYYLMLLRGLAITGDVFNISVKDLALLYEYWCFIKLNSLMKERYELISQDLIKVQGNGLYVSLVKGRGSRVKYRNPAIGGETITLSYNPKVIDVPTVSQRPDNVLTLEKKGTNVQYEYVFDAKYRLNPALPETDYYNAISHSPGPEVEDINTMHRYRDAIVYKNGISNFERTMFGAYVLFPYNDEKEYKNHRFYESIAKVNIGGLPFLPSTMNLVAEMLDDLIADSKESAFERATLPSGIEEKLAKVDWDRRDVLVGSLRNKSQLDVCMNYRFYHIPASRISEEQMPVRYIAIYQSKTLFGAEAGIRYYGEVIKCIPLPRCDIREIHSDSKEIYYRFEIKKWEEFQSPIAIKEVRDIHFFTNLFLLKHSTEMPELKLRSEEEYRFYTEIKRALSNVEINDESSDIGFNYKDAMIVFENGMISVYKDGQSTAYSIKDFTRSPGAVFRKLCQALGGV